MFSSKFFKDKSILLSTLVLGLLALFNVISVVLRADTSQSSTILRYWTLQGAPDFEKQGPEQLYSFALFAVIAFVIALVISYKLYDVYKPAAYTLLILTKLAIFLNIIVSGAILNLQQ